MMVTFDVEAFAKVIVAGLSARIADGTASSDDKAKWTRLQALAKYDAAEADDIIEAVDVLAVCRSDPSPVLYRDAR